MVALVEIVDGSKESAHFCDIVSAKIKRSFECIWCVITNSHSMPTMISIFFGSLLGLCWALLSSDGKQYKIHTICKCDNY